MFSLSTRWLAMVLFARFSCFVRGRFLSFFLGSWLFVHGFSVGPDNLSQSKAECLLGTEHRIA